MRCRKIENGNIVWFGSAGKTADGRSKLATNFADKQEGVANSLTQRLSVIAGELWYNITYGLPLLEKVDSKTAIDATVSEIVLSHPDVTDITEFSSVVEGSKYSAKMTVETSFGDLELTI